jgi:hypothetical protein
MTNAPSGTRRCSCAVWCVVSLTVTIGMEEYQIRPSIILVVTIPVMECEGFLALDPLSANGTKSLLLVQALRTKCRGCPQCELSITVLEVRLPLWIERVGVALDLAVALRFDRLLHPNDLLAARWIGEPPGCAPLMGKGAWRDPTASFLRVAVLGPSIPPSPNKTLQFGACLGTDDVPMVIGPTP